MTDIVERLNREINRAGDEWAYAIMMQNAVREITRLRSELEQARGTVYILERNASVQAELLADTGRELEQAKSQVEKLSTAIRKTSFLYDEYSRDPIDNDWNPVEKLIFEARSLALSSTESREVPHCKACGFRHPTDHYCPPLATFPKGAA